ncbi:DNA-binding PadR family transcriptional regulator [Friedmanniella endophytica]|uniref:DNA-binding PadR family transcriptional regulator n=1 Tax=Microlunatus kandeliicorticis TaxID=1759536 RepID=A0A7W3ISL8_9ACTN|nr:helix-turn-helix transcriptional regulator [Microlunatus kandeliicorticis]MBA8794425.1 DNA-binding PadR family transcriptional regulator [Microlunatus kandeliicorticis]
MAGAFVTRALVLGVVRLFEPVNGYQVTRELMSWQVEDWAKLKPGSVYSMLATLTKQDAILRHDLTDGTRPVAVYETTASGRDEFARMIREALDGSQGFERPVLDTGLAFAPYLTRREVITALDARLDRLDAVGAEVAEAIAGAGQTVPPHVAHMMGLDQSLRTAERTWLADFRDRLDDGYLAFLGEPQTWMPGPDDAGWEMVEQRRRYRELLDASSATGR